MTRLLILAALALLLALAAVAYAQELPPCGPLAQIMAHCIGTGCENGILDAYRLDVPDSVAVCAVDFIFVGSAIPISKWGNGCSQGLCTFGLPFGPELRAYTRPHDPAVIELRVWVDPRRKLHEPVVLWNYPYPYPPPD